VEHERRDEARIESLHEMAAAPIRFVDSHLSRTRRYFSAMPWFWASVGSTRSYRSSWFLFPESNPATPSSLQEEEYKRGKVGSIK